MSIVNILQKHLQSFLHQAKFLNLRQITRKTVPTLEGATEASSGQPGCFLHPYVRLGFSSFSWTLLPCRQYLPILHFYFSK